MNDDASLSKAYEAGKTKCIVLMSLCLLAGLWVDNAPAPRPLSAQWVAPGVRKIVWAGPANKQRVVYLRFYRWGVLRCDVIE